jgi:hypothetical protein
MATIINILERTSGGGGHAGNRSEPGTPVLVTVVTLLLFAITIATVLGSEGQDAADELCVAITQGYSKEIQRDFSKTTDNNEKCIQNLGRKVKGKHYLRRRK